MPWLWLWDNVLTQHMVDPVIGYIVQTVIPAVEMPAPLHAIRNSFYHITINPWLFGSMLAILANLALGLILWNWIQSRRQASRLENSPEELFGDLLNRLELNDADRRLLRDMATGARLKHPAMCLLSPTLLDWARSAWLTQRGPGIVTPEKISRLDTICRILFDHVPPRSKKDAENRKPVK